MELSLLTTNLLEFFQGSIFRRKKENDLYLFRTEEIYKIPLQILPGQTLSIVVENQGRICYGPELADRKGILGNVTLGGKILTGWRMTGMPLDDGGKILKYVNRTIRDATRLRSYKQNLR